MVGQPEQLMLAQLLCTRLCHDLAGPIGAVAAGVELTGGDPAQVDAETLNLIGSSSGAASRKLKFLRAALGLPPATPGAMLGELPHLIEGFLQATAGRNGPPAVAWLAPESAAAAADLVGAALVPLLLNLSILALEAQPACKLLRFTFARSPLRLTVDAEGDGARPAGWRPEILDALDGRGEATAKSVQAAFLAALAAGRGGRIDAISAANTVSAAFILA